MAERRSSTHNDSPREMKNVGVIGVIIGFAVFSAYYIYAYFNYDPSLNPPLNPRIAALNYVPIMLSMALLSLQLYLSVKGNLKKLYGFNAVFWMGVGLAYLFRDVLHVIESKLLIITALGLWIIFGLVLYFTRRR